VYVMTWKGVQYIKLFNILFGIRYLLEFCRS